jgi:hypothetical protein
MVVVFQELTFRRHTPPRKSLFIKACLLHLVSSKPRNIHHLKTHHIPRSVSSLSIYITSALGHDVMDVRSCLKKRFIAVRLTVFDILRFIYPHLRSWATKYQLLATCYLLIFLLLPLPRRNNVSFKTRCYTN